MPIGYWAEWSITRAIHIISQARDVWWGQRGEREGEQHFYNPTATGPWRLCLIHRLHITFAQQENVYRIFQSHRRVKCFGTMPQKTKHLLKLLGTTLELNMASADIFELLEQSKFRWEAAMVTHWRTWLTSGVLQKHEMEANRRQQ